MEYFLQQLVNALTLGAIYGLIAIGYTMVYGIIGMINFAHGDIFMVGGFIALIAFLILSTMFGLAPGLAMLIIVLIVSMAFTALINWSIERVAYRPLRQSFRLAPLISAIGMSIVLSNFVQVSQGARNKPIQPLFNDVVVLFDKPAFPVTISHKQILIMVITVLLLAVFWGTVDGRGADTYHAVSGRSFDGYATRWLVATVALFAGSAVIYLARRGSAAPRRDGHRRTASRARPRAHLQPGQRATG